MGKTDKVAKLRNNVMKAIEDGYMVMPASFNSGGSKGSKNREATTGPDGEQILNMTIAQLNAKDNKKQPMFAGNIQPSDLFIAPSSTGSEVAVDDKIGTPGLGYIQWGAANKLPNLIAQLTGMSPYTATAAKFNVDVAAGMGIVPKYRFAEISNGALMTRLIDYEDAGVLLEQQAIDARMALLKFRNEVFNDNDNDNNGANEPNEANEENNANNNANDNSVKMKRPVRRSRVEQNGGEVIEVKAETPLTLEEEIMKKLEARVDRADKAYEEWKRTKAETKVFIEHNNMVKLSLSLFNDMVYYHIAYPELELSSETTEQPDNAQWAPKVTGITFRDAQTCRLEKMDDQGVINYVYHSNRWLDTNLSDSVDDSDITAFPALNPEHPTSSLEDYLRKWRLENTGKKADNRPTRFILPSSYPSPGRPYYPQPSWWSIFGGDVYGYLSTIVSDRATRRKNKNIIGHIIYVHRSYLDKLEQQQRTVVDPKTGAIKMRQLTQEDQKAIIEKVWKEINEFLSNRDNSGKPLLAYTFVGNDGKEHDSFRIVDVPAATANEAKADKTELEEISAIVFFALQCHPELIGSVPGRTGAGGGTYQRELYLLKQCQMAPTQQLILKAMEVVSQINKWDDHLVWTIKQQVLTTLDNSKTGLKESDAQ